MSMPAEGDYLLPEPGVAEHCRSNPEYEYEHDLHIVVKAWWDSPTVLDSTRRLLSYKMVPLERSDRVKRAIAMIEL